MKQFKKLIQKNTLIITTSVFLISVASKCDQCKQKSIEQDNVTMQLTPAPDITGQALATITLQKKEGSTTLGNVCLTFTNPDRFTKEDGSPLEASMLLSSFLGKPAEEAMDDTALSLKVKAAATTQTANLQTELKLTVGNNNQANAYVSEQKVVIWQPITVLTFTVDKPTINKTDKKARITIIKTPGMPDIAYGDVYLTFSVEGTGASLSHFFESKPAGPGALISSTLAAYVDGVSYVTLIPDAIPITIDIEGMIGHGPGYVLHGEKLKLAIGKSATEPNSYVPEKLVVTWD